MTDTRFLLGGLVKSAKQPYIADAPDVKSVDDIAKTVPDVGPLNYQDFIDNERKNNSGYYSQSAREDILNSFDDRVSYASDPSYYPYFSPKFNATDLPANRVAWFRKHHKPIPRTSDKLRRENQQYWQFPEDNPGGYFPIGFEELPGLSGQMVSQKARLFPWMDPFKPHIVIDETYKPTGQTRPLSYFDTTAAHEGGHAMNAYLGRLESSPWQLYGDRLRSPFWNARASSRMDEMPATSVERAYSLRSGAPDWLSYIDLMYPDDPTNPDDDGRIRIPEVPAGAWVDQFGRSHWSLTGDESTGAQYTTSDALSDIEHAPTNYIRQVRNIAGVNRAYHDAIASPELYLANKESLQRQLDPLYAYYHPIMGEYYGKAYERASRERGGRDLSMKPYEEGSKYHEWTAPYTVKEILEYATSGDKRKYDEVAPYFDLLRPDLRRVLRTNSMASLHKNTEKFDNIMSILTATPWHITPEMVNSQFEFSITPGFDTILDQRSMGQMGDMQNFMRRGRDKRKYYQHLGENINNRLG